LNEIEHYTNKANALLDDIQLSEDHKQKLREFGDWLMKRTV